MTNKIIGMSILLLLAAAFLPTAIGNWEAADTGDTIEDFTAVNPATATEDYQLTFFPVNSATVSVDSGAGFVVQTSPGDYTINLTTGLISTATDTTDVGDTLRAAYNYDRDFGLASGIWPIIPLLVIAGIAFLLWRRKGT